MALVQADKRQDPRRLCVYKHIAQSVMDIIEKHQLLIEGNRSRVPAIKTKQKFRCGGRKGEECPEGGNTGVTPTPLPRPCPRPFSLWFFLSLCVTASFSLCNGRTIIDLFESICPSLRGYLVSLSFISTVPGMTMN